MRFTIPCSRTAAVVALALLSVACQPASGGNSPPGPGEGSSSAAGDASRGRQVLLSRGCGGCHALSTVPGAVGAIGPNLDGIGAKALSRRQGMTAEAYIRESIENPNAFVVPGFPSPSPMPAGLASGQELSDLVAFLLSQR